MSEQNNNETQIYTIDDVVSAFLALRGRNNGALICKPIHDQTTQVTRLDKTSGEIIEAYKKGNVVRYMLQYDEGESDYVSVLDLIDADYTDDGCGFIFGSEQAQLHFWSDTLDEYPNDHGGGE